MNALRRMLETLGLRPSKAEALPSLADYIASKANGSNGTPDSAAASPGDEHTTGEALPYAAEASRPRRKTRRRGAENDTQQGRGAQEDHAGGAGNRDPVGRRGACGVDLVRKPGGAASPTSARPACSQREPAAHRELHGRDFRVPLARFTWGLMRSMSDAQRARLRERALLRSKPSEALSLSTEQGVEIP